VNVIVDEGATGTSTDFEGHYSYDSKIPLDPSNPLNSRA